MIPLNCNRHCGAACRAVTVEALHDQARAFGWRDTGEGWMCPGCQRTRGIAVGLDELVSRHFPDTQPPPTLESERHDTIPAPSPFEEYR